MKKTQPRRRNINFRETRSERSATGSYRGFKHVILRQSRRIFEILRYRSG